MEAFGALALLGFVVQMVAIGILAAAFPLFWIWMLVDSVLRADHEYPGGGPNDKVVWVVLIALIQVVAVVYFFMVYRKVKRGSLPVPPLPATAADEGAQAA